MSEAPTKQQSLRKQRIGIVISTKMDKTIIVEFIARVPHPRFKKIVKRTKKFYAHDEKREAAVGDKVRIEETRPVSKLKCWRLAEVLTH
jgi:small subunit ribosomal protein S17